ncbi:hypothetical protein BDN71DRAFT_1563253 [Pleurotus eryngii]|uniref:Uncharacterized protein n=1 Tax=Pleurotus eryngii TaxID=5323 RepID=A0A9P6DG56_PLEER|nr:hypothetical protein BDN71DRAFT_1563253 [Pleurotus eryngii]
MRHSGFTAGHRKDSQSASNSNKQTMGEKTGANAISLPTIGQKRPISVLDSNEEPINEIGREPPLSVPKVIILQENRRNRRAAASLRIIRIEHDNDKDTTTGTKRASGLLQSRQVPVPTRLINEELETHAANPPAPANANVSTFEAAHQQKIKAYESLLNIVEPIIGLKTGVMDDDIRARELRALEPLVDVLTAERVRLNKITNDKTNEKSKETAEREGVATQKRTLERLGLASGSSM